MLSPSRVRQAPSWSPPRERSTMTSRKRSWLPSTETSVATRHGEPRRGSAAAGAGLAALEEVTEEDGVDLVLRVGLERLPKPFDVTLDVADDEGGSGHGLQDTFAREISRPRRPAVFGRPGSGHG